MIRLLLRLLRIKDFEPCASCAVLKQELEYARHEKRELLNTLITLTKPNVVIPNEQPKVLTQVPLVAGTFSRRKSILEEQHKIRGEVIKNSTHLARPDFDSSETKQPVQHIKPESIDKIEKELGLVSDDENASQR